MGEKLKKIKTRPPDLAGGPRSAGQGRPTLRGSPDFLHTPPSANPGRVEPGRRTDAGLEPSDSGTTPFLGKVRHAQNSTGSVDAGLVGQPPTGRLRLTTKRSLISWWDVEKCGTGRFDPDRTGTRPDPEGSTRTGRERGRTRKVRGPKVRHAQNSFSPEVFHMGGAAIGSALANLNMVLDQAAETSGVTVLMCVEKLLMDLPRTQMRRSMLWRWST